MPITIISDHPSDTEPALHSYLQAHANSTTDLVLQIVQTLPPFVIYQINTATLSDSQEELLSDLIYEKLSEDTPQAIITLATAPISHTPFYWSKTNHLARLSAEIIMSETGIPTLQYTLYPFTDEAPDIVMNKLGLDPSLNVTIRK